MSSDAQLSPSSDAGLAATAVPVRSDVPPTVESLISPLPNNQPKESLWPTYNLISTIEYTDPHRARGELDEILSRGLEGFTAPPDLWHNASMSAARCEHREAELALIQAGLKEWPDNIDLLCDELQMRYTSHYDPYRAKDIWERLSALPKKETGPYWRYWVYGAIYHATILFDRNTALGLLDAALRCVRRDSLMDVFRCYRRILVDSPPAEELANEDAVVKRQEEDLETLEKRYRLGLLLGVENGHVLALELARLYIERIGADAFEWKAEGSADSAFARRERYLQTAFYYLDLSELMFSGSPNYPIWDVYRVRISLLMAQRKYIEALDLLRSLPPSVLQDPSTTVMLRLAARKAGEPMDQPEFPERTSPDGAMLQQSLQRLLTNDGQLLASIARDNPAVSNILRQVVQNLR